MSGRRQFLEHEKNQGTTEQDPRLTDIKRTLGKQDVSVQVLGGR
jgi:hypothetical protein